MRNFETGATRDTDENKIDYEGFLSPQALERFGQYMLVHQTQADGKKRESDNWKKGIPQEAYKKSLIRHVFDFWKTPTEELACAIIFNIQGWLHEELKK